MRLLPKQLNCEHSLMPRSTQQPGLWAAHRTRGVDVLAACYCTLAPRLSRRCIKRKRLSIKNKQEGRKDNSTAGGERRREEGRTTGSKKQWPSSKMLRAPSNLHMLLSNSCKLRAIYKRWFHNVVSAVQFTDFSGTRCKHHAVCAMCR